MRTVLSFLALSALASTMAACGGEDGPTLADVQSGVFVGCTQPSCHSVQGHKGELILTAEMARAELIDVAADHPGAKAKGLVLVKPGAPAESFLLTKLKAPLAADLGDLMPQGTSGLDAATIQIVEDWIAAGAN